LVPCFRSILVSQNSLSSSYMMMLCQVSQELSKYFESVNWITKRSIFKETNPQHNWIDPSLVSLQIPVIQIPDSDTSKFPRFSQLLFVI
jgi:hypothetical protein